MTLQEAHELQRRELFSLRAEVKRLQKQADAAFPAEQREKYERHTRYLEQLLRKEQERYASERAMRTRSDQRCYDLEMDILELKDRVEALLKENEVLRVRAEKAEAEVRMLNGANKLLEKKQNMNFENSSLPSSALPFRKKIPNSRKPTGRKPGAQPGHAPHTVQRLLPTKVPVHLPVPDKLANDPDVYATGKTITKQLVDVRFVVTVRDYIADEYRNRVTGARLHAPFPPGVVNAVNYGPSVKAMAFLLNNYYNVSIAKTKQCIYDLTKGVVDLSTGMICNLSSEFSAATEAERARIFSLLTHARILYSDATVSNVNGTRKAVILCTDKEHVLYQHLDHKGHDGLEQTPVKNAEGIIVHDHDMSYYSYGAGHQECLAHVLRYLVGAMENEPELTWHKRMHDLLQEMIHTVKENPDGISRSQAYRFTDRYEAVLELADREYAKSPPSKYYPDGFNLQKRMRDFQDEHLYFLKHPKVDFTNNISERGLRKFKRKQKQSVVLRSNSGGQHICDALTIIETARMQCRNIYDVVEAAFVK